MILNQAQAEAVYSAMCALNNVSGVIKCRIDAIEVVEHANRLVVVNSGCGAGYQSERYEDQAAFATAYGLNSDEPQSDVAAAAGGLTQTAIER